MIVTKTPLRISFFGGGTDIPQFCNNWHGRTLSATIDSHIYIAVNKCVADHVKVIYSELELVDNANSVKHDRVRHALKRFGIESNIEIASFSDVPTKGTGLGSSSTFTVGLTNALYALNCYTHANPGVLAEVACKIEIDDCQQLIGKQDQYAAAFGGFNIIDYYPGGKLPRVTPMWLDKDVVDELEQNFLMFNTGIARMPNIDQQVNAYSSSASQSMLRKMVDLTYQADEYLTAKDCDMFGCLLAEAWRLKKNLSSSISNPTIDKMYEVAGENGALGGKLLGAGGGGYLLVYVPLKKQAAVINALSQFGKPFQFKFSFQGSTVEMNSDQQTH